MSNLRATIKRGEHKGKYLYPHKHKDNMYVATTSRFEEDYIRVNNLDELEALVKSGYGARMSNKDIDNAPSYIVHRNIEIIPKKKGIKDSQDRLNSLTDEVDLDKDSVSKNRKEQAFLREYLLEGKEIGTCVICSNEFPFDMLVAAHIKKRSKCNNKERKDFKNIAALMCKAGCDDLYEKNYIFVKEGKVELNSKKTLTPKMNKIISEIIGNKVLNWNTSKKYYEWHKSNK